MANGLSNDTVKKSTLDVATLPNKEDPNKVLGNLNGDFYALGCVTSAIQGSIFTANEGLWEPDIASELSKSQNIVLDANDPLVRYEFERQGAQVEPDKLYRLAQIEQYPELQKVTLPSNSPEPGKQGYNNILAIINQAPNAALIPHIDLVELIRNSVSKHQDIAYESNKLTEAQADTIAERLESLEVPLLQHAKQNCYVKTTQVDNLFGDNIDINPIPEKQYPSTMTHYNLDSMSRRRPLSDFFTVELIAPLGRTGEPQRVDLPTADGGYVTSLKLNMSPASLVINSAKKINRYQTLIRWVEEHWGDEMDQITFNGSSFSFLDFKTSSSGLCVDSRNMTEPYRELRHLADLYKTNGIIYQGSELAEGEKSRDFFNVGDPANPYVVRTHPRAGMVRSRLYIRLRCYFAEFVGYFESFDITESSDKPFSLNYHISFRSEHTKWL